MLVFERLMVSLFVMSLPISFSASYVPMSILFLYYLILWVAGIIRYRFPIDYLLLVLLYIWRGITMWVNGLKLTKLKELFDKSGYIIFSNAPADINSLRLYLHSLGIVISLIALLGIADRFSERIGRKEYIIRCDGYCSFQILKRTKVHIYNYDPRPTFAHLRKEGAEVDSLLPNPGYPAYLKLDQGNYELTGEETFFVHLRDSSAFMYRGEMEVRTYDITWDRSGKFRGFFSHKLVAAGFYSIMSILFLSATYFFRREFALYAFFALLSLLMTTSRAYVPSAFAGILILTGIRFRKRWKLLMGTTVVFIAITLAIMTIFNNSIASSMALRLNFWRAGLEIAEKHLAFGVGYHNISPYMIPYHLKGIIDNYAHAHSTYITALAETGIVGMLLVISILLYFSVKFIRMGLEGGEVRFLPLATGISFIVIALAGIFENNFDSAVLNLTMGFLMGLSVSKRGVSSNPPSTSEGQR